QAGGLTAEEVAVNIERKLEQYIRQPQVSVILTSLVSHQFLTRVRVTGAINKPISLPYRQGMTVLDVVLEAGGLSDFAVPARARLYRKNAQTGEANTMKIRLDKIIYKGDLSTNVELKAGDVLTVPERRF
ncbi:MAG: polysaccharide biosynthesis/export family protein, partial [Granulosicoccaceae bacterium]